MSRLDEIGEIVRHGGCRHETLETKWLESEERGRRRWGVEEKTRWMEGIAAEGGKSHPHPSPIARRLRAPQVKVTQARGCLALSRNILGSIYLLR